MLSFLLFVAVIWQTATFFWTDEDAIVLLDPKIHWKGFFFGDERKQSLLNVLCFKKQILFNTCNYIHKANE